MTSREDTDWRSGGNGVHYHLKNEVLLVVGLTSGSQFWTHVSGHFLSARYSGRLLEKLIAELAVR